LPAFGKQPNRQVRGLKFEDVTGTTMSEKLDKTGFVGGLYKYRILRQRMPLQRSRPGLSSALNFP